MTVGLPLSFDAERRLLGRAARSVLTQADREAFAGRRILITGAGGSIGTELARTLADCLPAALILLDHAEYGLFRAEQDLRARAPETFIDVVLGDVSRRADIEGLCRRARPDIVFHAAAYKHVTMAERAIVAAARTNVIGTMEVAAAARTVGARLVVVSTDKAAEPRSVMGATKRFAELLALKLPGPRRPMAVRFGNILASSGSVVEIMLRAVADGRPVPVTDPDATRFFMTAYEAASLVLKAGLIGQGGEVFWLDMGAPLRIGDLAERVISLAGPIGAPRARIQVIGLRPGEKVREELTSQGLEMSRTAHPAILSARQRDVSPHRLDQAFAQLRRACAAGDGRAAIAALQAAVDDYEPSEAALAAARATVRLTTPVPVAGARPAVLAFPRPGALGTPREAKRPRFGRDDAQRS